MHDAIMWQDKRTIDICQELKGESEFVYKRTGSKINPVFTAPKITWLKRYEPEIYNQAYKMIVIPDYVLFLITGKFMTDYTYGSRSSLMNIESLQWDEELLNLFEVDREKLCELVPQGSVAGHSTRQFYEMTGLAKGTPVISAGGDQQCAALGAGVIENGSIQVTTGTGSFIIASSDTLQLDPQMRAICNISAVPDKYVLESSILTTSTVSSWFLIIFTITNKTLKRCLKKLLPHQSGQRAVELSSFSRKGIPDWNPLAKGMFFNVTLESDRGDFSRSILESIALEISENIDVMKELLGSVSSISVAGGLTRSNLLIKFKRMYMASELNYQQIAKQLHLVLGFRQQSRSVCLNLTGRHSLDRNMGWKEISLNRSRKM
ncbi:FGGY family carbohydrate kinase [Bacillus sp. N9]